MIGAVRDAGASSQAFPHIKGLDSIRFVAALWVALSHGAALPLKPLLENTGFIGRSIEQAHGLLFNGIAAVMVFFLISGFCIHFPWVDAPRFDVRAHIVRRYIRVGGPLIVVFIAAFFLGKDVAEEEDGVLWSVYCELIYYSLYPIIFKAFKIFGIEKIIILSMIISLILSIYHWNYMYHWQFGVFSTWLIDMPLWLFGCLLASRYRRLTDRDQVGSIWYWRGFALFSTSATEAIVFHSPVKIGLPFSMIIFSAYFYLWMRQELIHFSKTSPFPLFEWAGRWSYSLYLVHIMVITLIVRADPPGPLLMIWAIKVVAVLATSYAFYRLIENPFHQMAKQLSRLSSRPPAIATL